MAPHRNPCSPWLVYPYAAQNIHTFRQRSHTHTHTHSHTIRHSKINTVRATMIPLHYLRTGASFVHLLASLSLPCISMEVVITKANISCPPSPYLPLACPLFLPFSSSAAFHKGCTRVWHPATRLTAEGLATGAGVKDRLPKPSAIGAECGSSDPDQSSGSDTQTLDVQLQYRLYNPLLVEQAGIRGMLPLAWHFPLTTMPLFSGFLLPLPLELWLYQR